MEHVVMSLVDSLFFEFCQQMFLLKKLSDMRDEDELFYVIVTCNFVLNDKHERIHGYFEEWLPRYLEQDFYSLYRMSRQTFWNLLIAINSDEKPYTGGEKPLQVEQQLLMTLWWLGKGETLISVSDKFNVAISSVFNSTEFMLDKLIALRNKYIVWPDKNEIIEIERAFREKQGFPGVIGAIDGTCIRFKPPKEVQNNYIDKQMNHSIKLQAIVTCNKIFTNVVVGWPGSAHDSRIFHNSEIYLDIEENQNINRYFHGKDFHLVGDKAYPLLPWIMTPYKDFGNMNAVKRHYNYCHSVTRIAVEHTFGILKGRWQILKYINVNSVVKAVKIIMAACVLHNFCYLNFDFWNDYEEVVHEQAEYNDDDEPLDANRKRNQIAQLL